jgi:hypothetical protein
MERASGSSRRRKKKRQESGAASADRSGTPGDAVTRRSFRFASLALSSLSPLDGACLLGLLLLPKRFSHSDSTAWRRL